MPKKLYIGNLPFDIQETELKEMFEAEGKKVLSVQIIMDKMSGRSRGFGFAEFENEDDAQSAIQAFNGKELKGRALVVNEAREQTRTSGGGGGGGRGGFGGGKGGRGFSGGGGDRNDRGRPPRW